MVATTLSLVVLAWRADAFGLVGSTGPSAPAVQPRGGSSSHTSGHSKPDPKPAEPSIQDGIATFDRTATLTSVAEACAATANEEQAGAVVLKRGVHERKARVTFTVPCAIQLDGSGSVRLHDMRIFSQTLNFSDTAYGAGSNVFDAKRTKWIGGPDAGLLVEFSDRRDRIQVRWSSLTYPLGISLQARGDRTEPDLGGTVRLHRARLSSQGDASEGITITASTRTGLVKANHSLFDAEQIAIMAARCKVRLKERSIDCRASTLAAALEEQAQAVAAEQAAAQR